MKKYKLIKEYPGSPELGTVVEKREKTQTFYYIYNDRKLAVLKEHVEDNPEYWEEVSDILFVVSKINYQTFHKDLKAWYVYKIDSFKNAVKDENLNYFLTKEEARTFILFNKPCLSYNDVKEEIHGGASRHETLNNIYNIVKSKL